MSCRVIALSSYAGTKALNQTIFKELGTCKKTWIEVACVAGSGFLGPIQKFRGHARQKPNWSLLRKLDLIYCISCISWHIILSSLYARQLPDKTLHTGVLQKNCNTCVTQSLYLLPFLLTLSFSSCLINKPFFLQASFNWCLCSNTFSHFLILETANSSVEISLSF